MSTNMITMMGTMTMGTASRWLDGTLIRTAIVHWCTRILMSRIPTTGTTDRGLVSRSGTRDVDGRSTGDMLGPRVRFSRRSSTGVDLSRVARATITVLILILSVMEMRAMRLINTRTLLVAVAAALLVIASCGTSDDTDQAVGAETAGDADRPSIAVTTNILGDVVGELVGDQAEVFTIMPVGADPHDFQASAQEIDQLGSADAFIVNGAGFEEGLLDVIESAEVDGVPTFEAIAPVKTIKFASESHGDDDDHTDEGDDHADEGDDHSDEGDEHGHDGVDPHFFTDPGRVADAVRGIAEFLGAEVPGLDQDALDTAVDGYLSELDALDLEIEQLLESVPGERRVLVTNHEVFGYFADRYGFEIAGTIIPGGTTVDSASAGELAELAELIESEGVSAIFADTSSPDRLVETLADEVGDIEIVELYSESLGDPGSDGGTYLQMMRTNAERIGAALA